VIGKTGRVVSIDSDGDVKVDFGGKTWILNPQCCIPVSQGQGQGQGRATVPARTIQTNAESSDDDDNDNNSKT